MFRSVNMTPVFQTILHNESTKGNCLRASLSSIFMINIDDIPKFELMDKHLWKTNLVKWIQSIGFRFVENKTPPLDDCYYISVGPSNRGVLHCIVSQNGKMAHDPHPSQSGLLSINKYWSFCKL